MLWWLWFRLCRISERNAAMEGCGRRVSAAAASPAPVPGRWRCLRCRATSHRCHRHFPGTGAGLAAAAETLLPHPGWQHFVRISDKVETKATKAIPSPHTCDCPFSTPLNIRCLALFKEKAHTSDIYTRNHTHCSTYTLVSDYQGSVFVEKEHDSPSQEPPAGLADFGMVASTVCVRPVVHTRDPRWPGGGTPPPPVAKGSR